MSAEMRAHRTLAPRAYTGFNGAALR